MNSSERLIKALKWEDYDRVPIWVLMNKVKNFTHAVDPTKDKKYKNLLNIVKDKADSLERINVYDGVFYSDSKVLNVGEKKYIEDGDLIKELYIKTNNNPLYYKWKIRKGFSFRQKTDYIIKEIEDIDKFLKLPYEPFNVDLKEFFKVKKELANEGIMMVNLWDPLASVCDLINLDNFYLWLSTDFKRIKKLFDCFYERLTDHLKYLLKSNVGPSFWIGGSEYCGPPYTSTEIWKKLVFNYDSEIIDLIHRNKCYVIYHHHGWIKDILDMIIEMKPDGLHPVEEPPYGNISLKEAYEKFKDKVCVIGNIQYDDLFNCNEDQIELKVKNILNIFNQNKGLIIALSAGPYTYSLDEKVLNNYIRFIESASIYT